jgi:hypothetical protein
MSRSDWGSYDALLARLRYEEGGGEYAPAPRRTDVAWALSDIEAEPGESPHSLARPRKAKPPRKPKPPIYGPPLPPPPPAWYPVEPQPTRPPVARQSTRRALVPRHLVTMELANVAWRDVWDFVGPGLISAAALMNGRVRVVMTRRAARRIAAR